MNEDNNTSNIDVIMQIFKAAELCSYNALKVVQGFSRSPKFPKRPHFEKQRSPSSI